jgi:crossover junction endodeoxyribonuclease RuvC
MRILGIDPGLRKTGFGVIEVQDGIAKYITAGVITTVATETLASRLKSILNGLREIITANQPDMVSIEKVFVNNNPQSTLLLGQARGAAITACVLYELEVFEYTALQIKKSVVGYGHAEKGQISKMVKYLLNLSGEPSSDAADALAVAIMHANSIKFGRIMKIYDIKK